MRWKNKNSNQYKLIYKITRDLDPHIKKTEKINEVKFQIT
jgi:hypothetical protein